MKIYIKHYQKSVEGICPPLYYSEYKHEDVWETDGDISELEEKGVGFFKLGRFVTEEKYTDGCNIKAIIENNNYMKNGDLYLNFRRIEEMYAW